MQPLSPLLAPLVGRWTTSFAGIATASLLVWYLGPLVPGLASPLPRALAILVLVLLRGGINGAMSWVRRRRGVALARSMTGSSAEAARDPGVTEAEAGEEVAALRARMRAALDRLGRTRGGGHLYERPWFVLIGPPGSGKTTALQNSGLHFPLDRDGERPLPGIGGTRLCDWWFADEAVLIDTAGRYTTQDSDAAIDRAGWLGFLDLLRTSRPRQPINGVVVVISLPALADADAQERSGHARAVRRRIDEINQRLRLRVPVYMVFSQADRLAGFDAYFDDLGAEERAQVWGATFAPDEGVECFAAEFRLLLERLDGRLVERLQGERSAERRALIAGFPLQVASLSQPLAAFMAEAFTGSRLDPAPFLRGAYMTSATQEGTPIDRLTGMLSRCFGVDQKRAPSLQPVAGRSYFIARLLREVILGEALLVSHDPARARRRRGLRIAGFSAAGIATLAGALLLWQADSVNRVAVERADEALAAYRQRLATITLDPVADDDLPHLVPLLDAAALPAAADSWAGGLFGLSQTARLAQADRLAQRRLLERVLLPRMMWRLEQQLRGRFDDPDFLYQATRIYLMLGSVGPLDRGLVRSWMQADWAQRYPGALNAAMRAQLLVHLDALMAEPLPTIALDGALVEAARATFSRVSLAERVYGRIRAGDTARQAVDWSPAGALGPAGTGSFVRPSGLPMSNGIPGLLTASGFHDVLEHDLPATTQAVAGESWVLGHAQELPADGPEMAALEQQVTGLWAADAERSWDALLDDLALAPDPRVPPVQALYVLSSPQSPLRDLLSTITQQLTLEPGLARAPDSRLAALIAGTGTAAAAPASVPDPALRGFAGHYQALRALTAPPSDSGGATLLDGVLRLVNQLQQELAQSASGGLAASGAARDGGDPAQLLLAEAGRQPQPLSRWLRQIAQAGTTSLGSAARSAAATAFSAGDGPAALCHSVVDGRYPFEAGSRLDAPMDDFARLFAPDGLLDGFFQSQLRPYVDTSGAVWRPHALAGVQPPVDAAVVAQFQRAAAIRDSFFPVGGNQPQLRFTLGVEPGSAPATLRLGSVTTTTGGATTGAVGITWPGSDGASSVQLSIGGAAPLQEDGPWALLRMLEQGRIRPDGEPGRFVLQFEAGGHAAFALQAGSSRSPFGRNLLRGFSCPVVR